MLNKRIIGVITILNGLAVQSFNFNRYLPIGRPEIVVENLARWRVDEILVLSIDNTCNNKLPDWNLIKNLSMYANGTPLSYGGGICDVSSAIKTIESGVERIVIDNLIKTNPSFTLRSCRGFRS